PRRSSPGTLREESAPVLSIKNPPLTSRGRSGDWVFPFCSHSSDRLRGGSRDAAVLDSEVAVAEGSNEGEGDPFDPVAFVQKGSDGQTVKILYRTRVESRLNARSFGARMAEMPP